MNVAASGRTRWMAFAALALVAALVTLLFWPVRNDPGEPVDEGLLLVEPEQVLDGKLPNRDFTSFYGPANTYLLSGVYEVFEPSVDAERGVGLIYRLAIVAVVFALALPAGLVVAGVAALISGLIMYVVLLPALAWFGGLVFALTFLLLGHRALVRYADGLDSGRWLAAAGLAGGVAISFRPQFALAVGLAAVPLVLGLAPGSWKRVALWTLIGALPLWVHLALAGPENVFENLIVDSLFRSGPESTLPLPGLGTADGRLFALLLAAVALLVVCAVVAWRREGRVAETLRLASLPLFCIGLLPQTLGRPDGGHIVQVACIALPLAAAAVASPLVLARLSVPSRQAAAAGGCALALAIGGWFIVQRVRSGYERAIGISDDAAFETYADRGTWVEHDGRSFPVEGSFVGSINDALAAIDRLSEPGDRIVVGPDDLRLTVFNLTYLYHLLPDLTPGTYYLTMDSGTANREGSGFAKDVAEADIVVMGTGTQPELVSPNAESGSDAAAEALAANFCLRERVPPLRIYTRCERPA